jgi:hypothetical protein
MIPSLPYRPVLGLSRKQWDEVYSFLVKHLDAPENLRFQFLMDYNGPPTPKEYRVCRALGFGGKLRYVPRGARLYVDGYNEDETPDVLKLQKMANAWLSQLVNALLVEEGAPNYEARCKIARATKAGDKWIHLKTGAVVEVLDRTGFAAVKLRHASGRITRKADHYLAGDYVLHAE